MKGNALLHSVCMCILTTLLLLSQGCEKPEKAEPKILFVRSGIAVQGGDVVDCTITEAPNHTVLFPTGGSDATKTAGAFLFPCTWTPGRKYQIRGKTSQGELHVTAYAPLKPTPFTVAAIPLEKVRNFLGRGTNPDTYVRFSEDERYLAIGSFFGYLRVVDVQSGKVVYKKRLAEGMVKRICWSKGNNGRLLFAGEQSPDAFVYAVDLATQKVVWRYRLADDIGTSKPDSGDPGMDIYNFPGPYFMQSLDGGDLIVIGLHGRYRGEEYVYDTQVLRLHGQTGKPLWKWPDDRTLPYSVTWAGASDDGSIIALLTDSWLGVRNPHPRFHNGALHCLDGSRGKATWEYVVPPLKPYYNRASGWQGVAVSPDGSYIALGLNDGRGMLFAARRQQAADTSVNPLWVRNVGTPVMNGNIPVASSIAYTSLAGKSVFFGLPGSTIPPNAGGSSNRKNKPAPHPRSHSLCAFDLLGNPRWEWQSKASVQGIFTSPDGRWVAAGITDDRGSTDPDEFGMVLFDSNSASRGENPLVYRYYTAGSVFFMGDVSATGRYVAFTEYPYSPDEGKTMKGEYQVHVVH